MNACLSKFSAQKRDPKSSFIFVGDYNAQPCCTRISHDFLHGRAAFNLGSSSGFLQFMSDVTHNQGGVLDVPLTDVPDTFKVCVNDSMINLTSTGNMMTIISHDDILSKKDVNFMV